MRRFTLLLASASLFAIGVPAAGETLQDALRQAYQTNPTLTGARAGQRAVDEGVPIAKSQAMPQLMGSTGYSEFVKRSSNSFTSPERQVTAGVNAELPIYQGGAVSNGIRAAKSRVEAGQADLRSTEANVFSEVVAAYMDVIRDQAIVELNRKNVSVLETNLRATRDRFEVGDLTRTDVAQSEARLAIARSQLESAEAQLVASRENYTRVVGTSPGELQPPPPLPGLPVDVEAAVDTAVANNPGLIAARKASEAAGHDIDVAKAQRMPKLSAVAGGNYVNYLDTLGSGAGVGGVAFKQEQTTATLGLSGTIPLYQGGGPGARVRQAQARASQSLEQVIFTERAVVAEARSAFSRYTATRAVIRSSEAAVSANELALEGVRAENSVGTRDILDVLNAEQELLNSRVQLVTAQRDEYVAGFGLLAAMGRAEARDLNLDGGLLYDPELNYRRVRSKFSDWSSDGEPKPQATRTYGPTQPANVTRPEN